MNKPEKAFPKRCVREQLLRVKEALEMIIGTVQAEENEVKRNRQSDKWRERLGMAGEKNEDS